MPQVTNINGSEMGWSNVTFNVLGRDVQGIMSIDYSDEQDKENLYGAGTDVVGRGYGQRKPEASMTLRMSEVLAIQAIAPNGDLSKIAPFPIIVKYIPIVPGKIVTDVIENVEFMGNNRKLKSGDKDIPVDFKLICSGIKWAK